MEPWSVGCPKPSTKHLRVKKSSEQIGKRSAGRPTTSRDDAAERGTSPSGSAVHICPTLRSSRPNDALAREGAEATGQQTAVTQASSPCDAASPRRWFSASQMAHRGPSVRSARPTTSAIRHRVRCHCVPIAICRLHDPNTVHQVVDTAPLPTRLVPGIGGAPDRSDEVDQGGTINEPRGALLEPLPARPICHPDRAYRRLGSHRSRASYERSDSCQHAERRLPLVCVFRAFNVLRAHAERAGGDTRLDR